jgi:hypothetical protein
MQLFLFVVFVFCVYAPDCAFVAIAGGDVVDGYHCGHHGVIHVVVAVLAVAS